MIPALMAAAGRSVSDLDEARRDGSDGRRARSEIGEVWLFDPSGTEPLPEGVRRLSLVPGRAAATWDEALVMARAMTAATRAGARHDEREPLVRARRGAARAAALRRTAHRPPDRGGPALDPAPRPRARRWKSSPTRAARSPRTCSSGSSAPTHGSARASSPRPPACSARTTPTRSRQSAAHPNFDPDRFAA